MSAHARQWWRRRRDIDRLRRMIRDWTPDSQVLIDRQRLVIEQLNEQLAALPVRYRPRTNFVVRGR